MNILVTGGTGFIGSNLVSELLKNEYNVRIVGSDTETPLVPHYTLHFNGLDWDCVKDVEAIFHQAANNNTQWQNKKEMMRANVDSPKELFERALDAGCKKFIYASSTAVYGNGAVPYKESNIPDPLTAYAESKLEFDKFILEFAKNDVSVIGLRYCNVFGPGEAHKGKRASMIHQLIECYKNNQRPKLFEFGEQRRDWIYVKDVVKANLMALNWQNSDILNCASGVAVSFNEIIQILNKLFNKNWEPEYIANPIKNTFQSHTCCDTTRIRNLGFRCNYTVEQGIHDMLVK